jgi:alginate O-acetyltransferase complex protein AlgI
LGYTPDKHISIFLPAGISFYTFMSISYLIEVFRKQTKADNIIEYGTYLSLFPHLIAGPIVRYSELKEEIKKRKPSIDMFFEGIWRFSLGLGKKVLIANSLGEVADKIFSLPSNQLTTPLAWIGTICYAFQIYFDFSGYSDMAIGLARFFGFHFPENFNQPYRATSITDFWRRWHMTLSRWFRDFVYIPLGGNRLGIFKMYRNLVIVFLLTGFWHGASWTFVIWGMYHGLLLVVEKVLKTKFNFEFKGVICTIITFVFVLISWVFFRSLSFTQAIHYIMKMFTFDLNIQQNRNVFYYIDSSTIFYLVLAFCFSFIPFDKLMKTNKTNAMVLTKGIISLILIMYCASVLSKAAFNPFIYFRF